MITEIGWKEPPWFCRVMEEDEGGASLRAEFPDIYNIKWIIHK